MYGLRCWFTRLTVLATISETRHLRFGVRTCTTRFASGWWREYVTIVCLATFSPRLGVFTPSNLFLLFFSSSLALFRCCSLPLLLACVGACSCLLSVALNSAWQCPACISPRGRSHLAGPHSWLHLGFFTLGVGLFSLFLAA